MEPLELTSARHGDHTVVAVRGELDMMSRDRFVSHLDEAVAEHGKQVVLDLSGLCFLDTGALSAIVREWRRLSSAGGSLVLAGARYSTARVLWITGLAQRLPMFDDVESALAAAPPASTDA